MNSSITTFNLKPDNRSVILAQAFNKIWNHYIINHGIPSFNHHNRCAYHGVLGARSPFGLLLPENIYSKDLENESISGMIARHLEIRLILGKIGVLALLELEKVHDDAAETTANLDDFTIKMQRGLLGFAQQFAIHVPTTVLH